VSHAPVFRVTNPTPAPPSRWEEFRQDFAAFQHAIPDKMLFFYLLAGWLVFFHFLGNSVFGYVDTPSLFVWMDYSYMNPDDEHGRYMLLVVLGLCWWKREELMTVPKAHWWPALWMLGGALILHVAGFVVQQTRLSIVAFFLGLYGLMGLVWGRAWLRAIFFPYFLFGFCMPLGNTAEAITFPLRMLVSVISVSFSHLVLGIDVVRDGTQIIGAQGFNYDVAPACSGIRSLTALFALTTIYGFVMFRTLWKRLLMMGIAFPLALLGNVIRIVGVILTAEVFGSEAGMKFHDGAGFVTFLIAIVVVMGLGRVMREGGGGMRGSGGEAKIV
jgi:exosortase